MAVQSKVALVTGGGSGIGRSAALALQGIGWDVVVAGRRKDELDRTVALAKAGGGKIHTVASDVGKVDDMKRVFAELINVDRTHNTRGTVTQRKRDFLVLSALGALSAALPLDAALSQDRKPPNQRTCVGMNPMPGKFVIAKETQLKVNDFGTSRRLSDPPNTGAKQLTVSEVNFDPGKGHNFHKHPHQEEVVLVVGGKVEQWIDREKRVLNPGDSAFIPADVVHASFNAGDEPAKIIAILGPCVGPNGYEVVDVANDAPWNMLRT